jgi:hypothetical protein
MNTFLIDNIVALAQEDEDIRTTILERSFSTHSHIDELSDYDVNVFARNYDKYLADDHWMSRIGEVMLYQKEQF